MTITAGAEWIPVSDTTAVLSGSPIDFSGFSRSGDHCGEFGRLVVRGGHFEFENLPGEPQRFYGVNLCFDANYMSAEKADELCRRLRLTGYNALRIHHYEGRLCEGSADGTTINPARMAELDNLLNACIEHGIYLTTDLFVSRPVAYRACGIDRDGKVEMQEFKELVVFHEGARSNLVAFTRALLSHVNPKTGRRWAEEPALAWLSLVNEGNPGNFGWKRTRQWLGIGDDVSDADLEKMAVDKEIAFVREMKQVLGELGYRGLVTDMNSWHNPVAYQKVRQEYDYVDDHFYVDHPKFLEKPWRLPSETVNRNPLKYWNRGVEWTGKVRLEDRPFTITEYNFSGPGVYRGIGGILFGAGAALQDMDGVWRFAWSHAADSVLDARPMSYFDVARDPLVRATERAIIALYLRGDMPVNRSVVRPDDSPMAVVPDDETNRVVCDRERGSFCVSTPRTVGGFAEADGSFACRALKVEVKNTPAAVWVTSLTEDPIEKSDRLLLTHLTDLQDSNARYRDEEMKVLEQWGTLPHLMRAGRAECVIRSDYPKTAVALNADGTPRREVPCVWDAVTKTLRITLDVAADPSEATYLYELYDIWKGLPASYGKQEIPQAVNALPYVDADKQSGLYKLYTRGKDGRFELRTSRDLGYWSEAEIVDSVPEHSNSVFHVFTWLKVLLMPVANDDGSIRFVSVDEEGGKYYPHTCSGADPLGDDYQRRWDKVNAEIDARIERYRKCDYEFGGFRPGEEVKVDQITSDFKFGCNLFNFDQFETPEKNAAYRDAFMNIFDAATIAFYWHQFEPEKGKPRYEAVYPDDHPEFWMGFSGDPYEHNAYRRPATDPLVRWCEELNIAIHGHVMIYPNYHPAWVKAIPKNEMQAVYDERIRQLSEHYGDRIPQWDVVNESVDRLSSRDNPHDEVCWFNKTIPVPPDYTYASYKAAEAAFPESVRLAINDAWHEQYPDFAARLIRRGAKIDVFGLQMHIFEINDMLEIARGGNPYTNNMKWCPQSQMRALRRIDTEVNRPIHISEVTIQSPRGLVGSAEEADAIQARVAVDNYRLWFSWPSVNRITYWNFVDGRGAVAERCASGFLDYDLKPKPVYTALRKLIREQWRTHLTVKADEQGVVRFRGFKGDYLLNGKRSH